MVPQMTAATAGAAQAAAHWPVMALEIVLAVGLFAAGLLIDHRVSRPGTARGPRVRAIVPPDVRTLVNLEIPGPRTAGPRLRDGAGDRGVG
jgi:hypothetical protein